MFEKISERRFKNLAKFTMKALKSVKIIRSFLSSIFITLHILNLLFQQWYVRRILWKERFNRWAAKFNHKICQNTLLPIETEFFSSNSAKIILLKFSRHRETPFFLKNISKKIKKKTQFLRINPQAVGNAAEECWLKTLNFIRGLN